MLHELRKRLSQTHISNKEYSNGVDGTDSIDIAAQHRQKKLNDNTDNNFLRPPRSGAFNSSVNIVPPSHSNSIAMELQYR
jgi:hypothetical protein